MVRSLRFYFGRFNVLAVYDDKRSMLLRPSYRDHFEVETRIRVLKSTPSPLCSFITGYLVIQTMKEPVARDDHSISGHRASREISLLHVSSGLIAFRAVAGSSSLHISCV
jgi:hypothetical protein